MKWKDLDDKELKDYHKVITLSNDGWITMGCKDSSGNWELWDVNDGNQHTIKGVIKWMPLPLIPKYISKGMNQNYKNGF